VGRRTDEPTPIPTDRQRDSLRPDATERLIPGAGDTHGVAGDDGADLLQFVPANVSDLERTQQELITAYITVLNEVSWLPMLPRKAVEYQPAGPVRDLANTHWMGEDFQRVTFALTWRFLVNLFVEIHLKGKCKELQAAFVRERCTRPAGEAGDEDASGWPKWKKHAARSKLPCPPGIGHDSSGPRSGRSCLLDCLAFSAFRMPGSQSARQSRVFSHGQRWLPSFSVASILPSFRYGRSGTSVSCSSPATCISILVSAVGSD